METMPATHLICSLAWDDVSHTSTRLLDVARSSWDEVDMAVINGLACGLAHVDANIETLNGRNPPLSLRALPPLKVECRRVSPARRAQRNPSRVVWVRSAYGLGHRITIMDSET